MSNYSRILKLFFLFYLLSISSYVFTSKNNEYIDTVNFRKEIFFHDDWIELEKKNEIIYNGIQSLDYIIPFNTEQKNKDQQLVKVTYNNKQIGLIITGFNDYFVMQFYPVEKEVTDWYTFGSMRYTFDKKLRLIQVRVYFQQDNNSYLEFNRKNQNKFDVYLFGEIYRKNLHYYFSFESLKYTSLYSILMLLEDNKIAENVLIKKNDFDLKNRFIDKIILPSVTDIYVDDGARNEFGDYVYIESGEKQTGESKGLNCSGFVKEISDNYIRLFNPDFKFLNINDLKKQRDFDRTNVTFQYHEVDDDPFFGIDWVNNIADEINKLCSFKIIKVEELKNDPMLPYDETRGYKVENLKEILFRDQKKNSNYFYIIVFNELRKIRPIVPIYDHLAIIVPYFEAYNFNLRIFESNTETNFEKTMNIHKNEKLIIIKVPLPTAFL